MAKGLSFYNWLRENEILGYIINCYAGVEPAPTNPAVLRRVFLWEDSGDVMMGNAEAFLIHMCKKFDRNASKWDASYIHELLRELGDSITPHQRHSRPKADGPKAGCFKQPDPEEWVVTQKAPVD